MTAKNLRLRRALVLVALCLAPPASRAEEFAFFSLIKDGKVAKDEIARHCESTDGRVRALSTASLNLTLAKNHERVKYGDRQFTNVNFSPGEWTGEVYKAICPGLYSVSVDFIATDKDGATAADVTAHIHIWRRGVVDKEGKPQGRPGDLAGVAFKAGPAPRGTGHASALLALGTGDEISTHSLSSDGKPRHFERIELNVHRVQPMPDLARDYVAAEWEADRAESEKVRFAP
jgi:hypothetical protein